MRKSPCFVLVVAFLCLLTKTVVGERQVWAWAGPQQQLLDAATAQLKNASWTNVIGGVEAYCGVRFTDTGLAMNRTQWKACAPLRKAARDTNRKFQCMIQGDVPQTAIDDPTPYIRDALSLYDRLDVDGFSLDDERDCAPRATLQEFKEWISFQNQFATALQDRGATVSSAVQAMFGIQDRPDNVPCKDKPASYPLEPVVTELVQNAVIDRWLVMDTYYFTTARFLGALDWHVKYFPASTLGFGLMNRDDLLEDELVARFYALHESNVEWINVWRMPIDDKFLPYMQRWKAHCRGCGEQISLGCFDMTIECNFYDDHHLEPDATVELS